MAKTCFIALSKLQNNPCRQPHTWGGRLHLRRSFRHPTYPVQPLNSCPRSSFSCLSNHLFLLPSSLSSWSRVSPFLFSSLSILLSSLTIYQNNLSVRLVLHSASRSYFHILLNQVVLLQVTLYKVNKKQNNQSQNAVLNSYYCRLPGRCRRSGPCLDERPRRLGCG
jgi:hypothetical protein